MNNKFLKLSKFGVAFSLCGIFLLSAMEEKKKDEDPNQQSQINFQLQESEETLQGNENQQDLSSQSVLINQQSVLHQEEKKRNEDQPKTLQFKSHSIGQSKENLLDQVNSIQIKEVNILNLLYTQLKTHVDNIDSASVYLISELEKTIAAQKTQMHKQQLQIDNLTKKFEELLVALNNKEEKSSEQK